VPPWSESLAEIHDATLLRPRTSSVSELPDARPWCDTGFVGSSEFAGYCSFTKAIEHLGDRWVLLIVRELGVFGPLGFNELATALPGRISRSVLADRLRRLEILGLVSRGDGHRAHAPYRLTAVGASLMPTILSLRGWADSWLPDDPDMLEREPAIVLSWLAQRVAPEHSPTRPVVIELRLHHRPDPRYWLVIQRDLEPYGCLTDPFLDTGRYVYLVSAMSTYVALARGRLDWADAFQDGSLTAAGDPELVSRVATWFQRSPELSNAVVP
jgi:DNA-binding HxlR family transcriptional regulator